MTVWCEKTKLLTSLFCYFVLRNMLVNDIMYELQKRGKWMKIKTTPVGDFIWEKLPGRIDYGKSNELKFWLKRNNFDAIETKLTWLACVNKHRSTRTVDFKRLSLFHAQITWQRLAWYSPNMQKGNCCDSLMTTVNFMRWTGNCQWLTTCAEGFVSVWHVGMFLLPSGYKDIWEESAVLMPRLW